jgi:uncharacterized protein (DUF1330 family)
MNQMPSGFWVSCYRAIHDSEKLAAYAGLAKPAIEQAGGQFLVRGTAEYASGSGLLERTVIVQWPSLDDAIQAYHSAAYQAALDALGDGVDRDFRIVEGV